MASGNRPLREFAALLVSIALLAIVSATIRLKLETWIKTRSDPTQFASATATRPPAPIPSSTQPDFASPATAVIAMATRAAIPTTPSIARNLPSPAAAATAIPKRPREPTSPAPGAAKEAPDLAFRAAAAAKAKSVVEQSFEIPNATIFEPVIADGGSVDGGKRPRYQTEVTVEMPRGFGTPVQRLYFLTLHYVGGGEWQIEGMKFVTRY
jgi:hypothetical protein